jgi:hypothetical protein
MCIGGDLDYVYVTSYATQSVSISCSLQCVCVFACDCRDDVKVTAAASR